MTTNKNSNGKGAETPFLTDVSVLRERARAHMDQGAVTPAYRADLQTVPLAHRVQHTRLTLLERSSG